MDKMTALIIVGSACDDDRIRHHIAGLPDRGVHTAVLVAGSAPLLPVWAYGASPYAVSTLPDNWQDDYATAAQDVADRADVIEKLLQAAGVQGDVTTAFGQIETLDDMIAARAGLCDIALIDSALRDHPDLHQQVLDGILFKTPIAAVINAQGVGAVTGARNVLVAWDASLPAMRALHRALPILRQAASVTLLVVDPRPGIREGQNPGTDAATWLTRHGCKVAVQQTPRAGGDIGDCILDRARDLGSDLIVMGAYAHSRARQRIFGGTTRIVVGQTEFAVLLAH